jgi:hypothetical protein
MPSYSRTVNIPGKSSQEIYDVVSGDIDRFLEKAIGSKYQVSRDPGTKKVDVKTSLGVSATLTCAEGSIAFNAQLSLLASPFKGKLDEGITRWLSKKFPGAT